jgi:thiopeptide-type bacteriocin biosynthesis protein
MERRVFWRPKCCRCWPTPSHRVGDGQVARWQLDTYVREVERYGGDDGILLAERLFGVDSACVLALLAAVPGDEGLVWRWKLALCGVDLLLDALGFSLHERCDWVRARRDAFASEFHVGGCVKRHLGEKHRAERQHSELMARRGAYHELVQNQASPIAGELV